MLETRWNLQINSFLPALPHPYIYCICMYSSFNLFYYPYTTPACSYMQTLLLSLHYSNILIYVPTGYIQHSYSSTIPIHHSSILLYCIHSFLNYSILNCIYCILFHYAYLHYSSILLYYMHTLLLSLNNSNILVYSIPNLLLSLHNSSIPLYYNHTLIKLQVCQVRTELYYKYITYCWKKVISSPEPRSRSRNSSLLFWLH